MQKDPYHQHALDKVTSANVLSFFSFLQHTTTEYLMCLFSLN